MSVDINAIILSLLGGGGLISTILTLYYTNKRSGHSKAAEDKAVDTTSTPAAPGGSEYTVAGLVGLASTVSKLSKDLDEHSAELDDVRQRLTRTESRLEKVTRSYESLWPWVQRVISDWHSIRHKDLPPALPEDLHHP